MATSSAPSLSFHSDKRRTSHNILSFVPPEDFKCFSTYSAALLGDDIKLASSTYIQLLGDEVTPVILDPRLQDFIVGDFSI